VAWIGSTVNQSPGGALIRIDAEDGTYEVLRYDQGWPLPGKFVSPLAITPDGRVWMQYDSDFLTAQRGLCWYDGTNVGVFPAPPGGEPQWSGLPHAQIDDCEVRLIRGGYELWLSCLSRGIAVLTVNTPTTPTGDTNGDGAVDVDDLVAVILAWGLCPAPPMTCPADVNGSGAVDVDDLIMVILNWG
jgi:hypothetical protein